MKRPCRNASQTSIIKMRELHPIHLKTFNFNWMKKLFVSILFLFSATLLFAQPQMEIGIKAGLNNSKITFNKSQYSSESIVKAHYGVYGRFGFGRIYIQPELYFSAKGGEVFGADTEIRDRLELFDYNNLDIPLLLGFKVFDGKSSNIHIVGGPVFSLMTDKTIKEQKVFSKDYLKDNTLGFQYGVGFDIWRIFLEARMEHGANNLYVSPNDDVNGKNRTFMLTLGFRIF